LDLYSYPYENFLNEFKKYLYYSTMKVKKWDISGHNGIQISIHHFQKLDSTNKEATRRATAGAPAWTVVVADEQTEGRGRYNRQWLSTPDLGIYFSFILKPMIDLPLMNLINLRSALVVREFLQNKISSSISNRDPEILVKWPNDVLAGGKKICGILLESEIVNQQIQFLIVGIGININHKIQDFPRKIRDSATSLRLLTSQNWGTRTLVNELILLLQRHLSLDEETNFERVVGEYEKYLAFKGSMVEIDLQQRKLKGRLKGIDSDGFLLLEQENQIKKVTSGDLWI